MPVVIGPVSSPSFPKCLMLCSSETSLARLTLAEKKALLATEHVSESSATKLSTS